MNDASRRFSQALTESAAGFAAGIASTLVSTLNDLALKVFAYTRSGRSSIRHSQNSSAAYAHHAATFDLLR